MKAGHVLAAVVATGVLLSASGCVLLPQKRDAGAQPSQVRQAGDWSVWVSLPSEQAPDEATKQRALALGQQQLSERLTRIGMAPVNEWLARQPRFMHQLLARMDWKPLELQAPVYAVQVAWAQQQRTVDAQVELDWAKLVAQLKDRMARVDEALRCYRRVPDQVSHLRQLRALVPALPLLLERMQLRALLWRFEPGGRISRADHLARLLLERIDTLAGELHVEVDTEVEKHEAFERLLKAQLTREGFSLRAKPADMRVFYEVNRTMRQTDGGVVVSYATDLQLTDGQGVPFAFYHLDAQGRGLSAKLADAEAMSALSQSIVDKMLDYLLKEYRLQPPCREWKDDDA